MLGGPAALVIRLEQWVARAGVGGLALLAMVFGVVARSTAAGNVGVQMPEQVVGRLGGHQVGAAAWMGYEFLWIAALVAFAAAAQISGVPARRPTATSTTCSPAPSAATPGSPAVSGSAWCSSWPPAASRCRGLDRRGGRAQRHRVRGEMQAGLNVTVPGLFILGLGTLLYGLAPRLAVPILYAVVLWSFLVEIIGSNITKSHRLLDTALLSTSGRSPRPASTGPQSPG